VGLGWALRLGLGGGLGRTLVDGLGRTLGGEETMSDSVIENKCEGKDLTLAGGAELHLLGHNGVPGGQPQHGSHVGLCARVDGRLRGVEKKTRFGGAGLVYILRPARYGA
jgi:hypothetical protein